MIAFYADECVERQIVLGLNQQGIDVLTVEEDGLAGSPDEVVLDRAGDLARVVFTRDRDFLRMAVRRQRAGEPFAGVVYARKAGVSLGNVSTTWC